MHNISENDRILFCNKLKFLIFHHHSAVTMILYLCTAPFPCRVSLRQYDVCHICKTAVSLISGYGSLCDGISARPFRSQRGL